MAESTHPEQSHKWTLPHATHATNLHSRLATLLGSSVSTTKPPFEVVVVGAGLSGLAATTFFLQHSGAASVRVVESCARQQWSRKAPASVQSGFDAITNTDGFGGFSWEVQELSSGFFSAEGITTIVVVSPGVPTSGTLVSRCRSLAADFSVASYRDVIVVNELDIFATLTGTSDFGSTIHVVTGSNGKSTTVSLLHQLLEAHKPDRQKEIVRKEVVLCGNIGTPLLEAWSLASQGTASRGTGNADFIVEASSYQLEGSSLLLPEVACFLNLSENHLARHGTMQAYFEAKASVFLRQHSPHHLAVICIDDTWGRTLVERCLAVANSQQRIALVSADKAQCVAMIEKIKLHAAGARLVGGACLNLSQAQDSLGGDILVEFLDASADIIGTLSLSQLPLQGHHNLLNAAVASYCAWWRMSCRVTDSPFSSKKDALCEIQQRIPQLQGLPHRFEYVGSAYGAAWYNDSKATSVVAVVRAIYAAAKACQSDTSCVVMLLGGALKEGSPWQDVFSALHDAQLAQRSAVICFGDGADTIAAHAPSWCHLAGSYASLTGALGAAADYICSDAICADSRSAPLVVVSPGGASFDEFLNFEHRGTVIRDWVTAHTTK